MCRKRRCWTSLMKLMRRTPIHRSPNWRGSGGGSSFIGRECSGEQRLKIVSRARTFHWNFRPTQAIGPAMEQGTTTHNGKTPDTEFPLGFPECIMLIATMMALNALSIDPMLPALPAMGKALGIIGENERQWIISSYFLGLVIGSLFYGSL